jgi:hypothetical protein
MKFNSSARLTFLSNFSWSNQNVLELLCETACLGGYQSYYFPKPLSIFRKRTISELEDPPKGCITSDLKVLPLTCNKIPLLKHAQRKILCKYIFQSKSHKIQDILFYNNLDAIDVITKKLRLHFEKLIFLCADYSEIDDRFNASAKIADKILVIPKSMIGPIEKVFPGKSILWPQPTSSQMVQKTNKDRVEQLLLKIPKPRIIYAGSLTGRVDQVMYGRIAENMPTLSFVSVGDDFSQKSKNIFQIPWLKKNDMLFFLSQCQVGFLPYDLSNLHNLHCVPLKLLDCMSIGLPVVITKLKNIDDFHPFVYLAETEKELLRALETALSEKKDAEIRINRKKRAEMHQTENLVQKLDLLIEKLIVKNDHNN